VEADKSFMTVALVLYDAVFIPRGHQSVVTLQQQGNALHFVNEAFQHCKPISALGEGIELLQSADLQGVTAGAKSKGKVFVEDGVVTMWQGASLEAFIEKFIQAISEHKYWGRSQKEPMPA
jgi:catalase